MKTAQNKRKIGIFLLCMLLLLAGCQKNGEAPMTTEEPKEDRSAEAEGAMSWEEFERAELDAPVVVDGKIKEVFAAEEEKISLLVEDLENKEMVYEIVDLYCDQEAQKELVVGAKIRVMGYKTGTEETWTIQHGDFEFLDEGK